MNDLSSVDETMRRLAAYPGVQGVVVATGEGIPVRSTFESDASQQHAALATMLSARARSAIRELDGEDELQFLRIRTRKGELLVAPGTAGDRQFCLVVLQSAGVD